MTNCNDTVFDISKKIQPHLLTKPTDIVIEDIKVCFKKFARTVDNVFSKEECMEIIKIAEDTGFSTAGIGGRNKQEVLSSIRSSQRILCEDKFLAFEIWERVKDHIPIVWKGRHVIGLNELLRFLKYQKADFFAPHVDGNFCRNGTDNISQITLQLYLSNSEKEMGGATTFCSIETEYEKYNAIEVFPKIGRVLLFDHKLLHEGSIVNNGVKYTIRTDVEYGPYSFTARLLEMTYLGSSPHENKKTLKIYASFLFVLFILVIGLVLWRDIVVDCWG